MYVEQHVKMRKLTMFITAVCVLFLIKLWMAQEQVSKIEYWEGKIAREIFASLEEKKKLIL